MPQKNSKNTNENIAKKLEEKKRQEELKKAEQKKKAIKISILGVIGAVVIGGAIALGVIFGGGGGNTTVNAEWCRACNGQVAPVNCHCAHNAGCQNSSCKCRNLPC
ncbi:MAG: hypothetical protein FWD49_05750 [Firmicutes bacterium]|nr:hypothetical protein [Bacillota bacterium]